MLAVSGLVTPSTVIGFIGHDYYGQSSNFVVATRALSASWRARVFRKDSTAKRTVRRSPCLIIRSLSTF